MYLIILVDFFLIHILFPGWATDPHNFQKLQFFPFLLLKVLLKALGPHEVNFSIPKDLGLLRKNVTL